MKTICTKCGKEYTRSKRSAYTFETKDGSPSCDCDQKYLKDVDEKEDK